MTSSAKSVKGSTQSIDYLIEEGKGYELDRNKLFGETSKEIMASFKMQQQFNTTCNKKFITAYISPHPKDGEKLSDTELKAIAREYMTKLNIDIEKQAYLAVVHTEKHHKHVHLLINRIDSNNKAIRDQYIVKRSQDIAHKIAKERGLISARDLKNKNIDKKLLENQITKKRMAEIHKDVLSIKPANFSKYQEYMKAKGLLVTPAFNSNNKVQGFYLQDMKTGQKFKMSEIKKGMSAEVVKNLKFEQQLNTSMTTINKTTKRLNKDKSIKL